MRNWRGERASCMLRHRMRALSAQVRYAICGIFDLAYNADMKPVQLRVIGERQNIPPRYLEQIFQRLRKAGLVEGKRGPGGGYTLLRGTAEITLRDVVEAVEGPILGGETRNPKRAAAAGESFLSLGRSCRAFRAAARRDDDRGSVPGVRQARRSKSNRAVPDVPDLISAGFARFSALRYTQCRSRPLRSFAFFGPRYRAIPCAVLQGRPVKAEAIRFLGSTLVWSEH
jgi:Rrf2 family protein